MVRIPRHAWVRDAPPGVRCQGTGGPGARGQGRDRTMQSEDQALRRKAERSVAVAGLARTVQHDINNLLTVIFANLEMLKRNAAEGPPQRQLGRVEEAARRFERTSRAILSLIRRPAGEVAPIRLSDALAVLQPLLQMILS